MSSPFFLARPFADMALGTPNATIGAQPSISAGPIGPGALAPPPASLYTTPAGQRAAPQVSIGAQAAQDVIQGLPAIEQKPLPEVMPPPTSRGAPVGDAIPSDIAMPFRQPAGAGGIEGAYMDLVGRAQSNQQAYQVATERNADVAAKAQSSQADIDLQKAKNDLVTQKEAFQIQDQAAKEKYDRDQAFMLARQGQQAKVQGLDSIVAHTQVDPNRIMGKAANQVIAGLATAFGEYARIRSGGQKNLALEAINKAVDEDVRSQAELLGSRQRQAVAARSQLADMSTNFATKEEAILGLTYAKLGAAKRKADELALKLGTPQAENAATQIKAGISQRQLDISNQLTQAAIQSQATMLQPLVKSGQYALPTTSAWRGATNDETLYREAIHSEEGFRNASNSVKKILGLIKNVGAELFPSKDAAIGKQLAKDLSLMAKETYKLGVLSDSDKADLASLIPNDPTGLKTYQLKALLENYQTMMNDKIENSMNVRGFTPKTVGSFKPLVR